MFLFSQKAGLQDQDLSNIEKNYTLADARRQCQRKNLDINC